MKRHLILPLMFSLIFALSLGSVISVPELEGVAVTKANGTEFSYKRNYGFQVEVKNVSGGVVDTDNSNISAVIFELTRPDTGAANFTGGTTPTVTNDTTKTYWINFTQEQLGQANESGNFQYKWFANCTADTRNESGAAVKYQVNKSTNTINYFNITRRRVPDDSMEYYWHNASVNLSYSSPISQNITGWYNSTETAGQTITFTLYKDSTTSKGTSNPQSTTEDYTDQTDTWEYNTSGNNNYTSAKKVITITSTGGGGGGGGGSDPPPTNIPCPYECCVDDGQHLNKLCDEGTCINHNCIVGVTTMPTVTTMPGWDIPIIGNVQIGMNFKFIALMFGVFISLIIFIGLIYIVFK